jgi:hypothetical protein
MMLVRMPPPTPAKPEDKPIAAPATIGNLPPGSRSVIGRNRLGKAKTNLVAAGRVARGWDSEFESALLQERVRCEPDC